LADSIGIGVVGVGILGERHARVFSELSDSELIAVADTNNERAERVANQLGVRAYDDHRALLDDPAVGAVAVATPDHLHFEPVMAALKARKHVLVEKPLATTVGEAKKMVTAAQSGGLILQVNFSQRFVPDHVWAKGQIQDGAIGELLISRSVTNDTISVPTEMISWAASTSPIFFMTSHHLDLVCWYHDAEVEEAYAYEVSRVLKERRIAVHDAVEALVRFTNGATATFHSSWIYPNSYPTVADSSLELVGSEGVILLGRGDNTLIYSGSGGRKMNLATTYEIDGTLHGAFRYSLELFLRSVTNGLEPMTSGSKTLGVTLAQCAILESLAQHRPIKINEFEGLTVKSRISHDGS
jgi:predicted dehydrogenase